METTDGGTTFALLVFFMLLGAGLFVVRKGKTTSLTERLNRFFGRSVKTFTSTSRTFQGIDLPNIHIAIKKYAEEHNGTVEIIGHMGYGLRYLNTMHMGPQGPQTGAIQYSSIDTGTTERMQCPRNGIYLVDCPDGKVAIEVNFIYEGGSNADVVVLSNSDDTNARIIEEIRELMRVHSVFKGKILSLEGLEAGPDIAGWLKVRFHEFPKVEKHQIILPEETQELIERNVMSFYKHSESLKKAGKSLKRGILFYGKPGTGKTFTAKYLAQYLEGVTVFILSGEQLWLVKEVFQLARLLAPSLVIMEDVDLIAHTRDETLGQTILHQLLNELDGLTKSTEIIFLLTTNRPEVLEPALALRPGRVDQAIKFPLPDADCRKRLVEQYAEGMDLEVTDMARLIERSEGASPSFIQELMRKAALIAAEQNSFSNGNEEKLLVKDAHLQKALDELLLSGPLTRTLVGFHAQISKSN